LKGELLDNGKKLRDLIESSNLTQEQARVLVNVGQARPIAISTWKAYLAGEDSSRKRPCPDLVVDHAEKVLKKYKK